MKREGLGWACRGITAGISQQKLWGMGTMGALCRWGGRGCDGRGVQGWWDGQHRRDPSGLPEGPQCWVSSCPAQLWDGPSLVRDVPHSGVG